MWSTRIGRPCCSCRTAGSKNGEGAEDLQHGAGAEGVAEGQRAFRVAEAEGDGAVDVVRRGDALLGDEAGAVVDRGERQPSMMPTLTSGWQNEALRPATMMSACIASSQPPPQARPLTAAITGLGQAAMVCRSVWVLRSMISTAPRSAMSRRSAPAAKTVSPPVSTMQRTS